MLVTTLEADPYLGRVLTGRIESGAITMKSPDQGVEPRRQGCRTRARHQAFGLPRLGARAGGAAEAGDIIAIAGLQTATVADTLCDIAVEKPIFATPIDPPTLAMTILGQRFPAGGTAKATRCKAA